MEVSLGIFSLFIYDAKKTELSERPHSLKTGRDQMWSYKNIQYQIVLKLETKRWCNPVSATGVKKQQFANK